MLKIIAPQEFIFYALGGSGNYRQSTSLFNRLWEVEPLLQPIQVNRALHLLDNFVANWPIGGGLWARSNFSYKMFPLGTIIESDMKIINRS